MRLAPRASVAALLGAAMVVVAIVALLVHGGGASTAANPSSSASPASHARYGGLPAWLPEPKVRVGRVLQASAAHPALSIQGEAVRVSLPSGAVLATAAGPEVPEEGRFPVPEVTPTTFMVTFSAASRPIALNASAFTLIDERGMAHHPKLTALHRGSPPAVVRRGRATSVALHAILPTGDGGLSWTPQGTHQLVTWDYTVEID
jgi:hypothetical protein